MNNKISHIVPDRTREEVRKFWDPSRQLLKMLRIYEGSFIVGGIAGWIARKYCSLAYKFWTVITGADIPINCKGIGGGLLMPHPNGIVIHPDAQIGSNCLIFQQVTIGEGSIPGVPSIGGHVDIGAGAKILGGIKIGNHVKIGANAVVITDVPDYCVAVGIPARVIYPTMPSTRRNYDLNLH